MIILNQPINMNVTVIAFPMMSWNTETSHSSMNTSALHSLAGMKEVSVADKESSLR